MKFFKAEIVTADVLRRQGETNQAIAKRLGITQGTVRYHLKRMPQQVPDGRAKPSLIEQLGLVEVIEHWWAEQLELLAKDRSPNVKEQCKRPPAAWRNGAPGDAPVGVGTRIERGDW